MNEFDQFVLHSLKPVGYIRYGDDFVLWFSNEFSAKEAQTIGTQFLVDKLKLRVNFKHDRVQPTDRKLAYLGVDMWPENKRLNKRVQKRISAKLTTSNAASYATITNQYLPKRYKRRFTDNFLDILDQL